MTNPQDFEDRKTAAPGVSFDQIRDAVNRSGYPLQFFTGELLRDSIPEKFDVQDEWGYIDRDTKELRSLDIRADLRLYEWSPQPRVRPHLTLLIECKQSEMPYLFFGREPKHPSINHPQVAGLQSDEIRIRTDDSRSTWTFHVGNALSLDSDPFQRAPFLSTALSKCVRKGRDLELSGTDVYNGIVLPLVKALDHFQRSAKPVSTARYFDAHLAIPLAVIDGPMFKVEILNGEQLITEASWVRVSRHEFDDSLPKYDRDKLIEIDFVKRSFLQEYLCSKVIPLAKTFAERVLRHPAELATGGAFISGMETDSWLNIEERLRPDPKIPLPVI